MRFHAPRVLSAAVSLLLAGACALPGGAPMSQLAPEINATLTPTTTVLAPGDQIEVRFAYAEPSWNQIVVVQPDGYASFLAVDKVRVGGLLPEQLDEILTNAYAQVLDNPSLSVVVVTPVERYVHVLGEVAAPGEIVLAPQARLTLIDAIARTGGFLKQSAHLGSVLLVRWDSVNQRQVAWKIDARDKYWGSEATIFLQPFDVVYIPNTPVDNVALWLDNYVRRMIPLPGFISGA